MISSRFTSAKLTLLLLFAATNPSFSEEATPDDSLARIAEELSNLTSLFESLHKIQEEQLEAQELGLVMRRTELAAIQVENLENQLYRSRIDLQKVEKEVELAEIQLEEFGRQRQSGGEPAQEIEKFWLQWELRLVRLQERQNSVTNEVSSIEGRLTRSRIELQEWKDLLDQRLSDGS